MRACGFSLVEVVVTITIVSALLAIGTLKFIDFVARYKTEAETRTVYSTLLKARSDAVYQRRGVRVKLYSTRLEVYSSTSDNTKGSAPVRSRLLSIPLSCNGSGDATHGYPIDFDSRGVADACSVCMDNRDGLGGVDSIVISEFRVSIGKKDKGYDCKAGNITLK